MQEAFLSVLVRLSEEYTQKESLKDSMLEQAFISLSMIKVSAWMFFGAKRITSSNPPDHSSFAQRSPHGFDNSQLT
jgi:hypothetical protein